MGDLGVLQRSYAPVYPAFHQQLPSFDRLHKRPAQHWYHNDSPSGPPHFQHGCIDSRDAIASHGYRSIMPQPAAYTYTNKPKAYHTGAIVPSQTFSSFSYGGQYVHYPSALNYEHVSNRSQSGFAGSITVGGGYAPYAQQSVPAPDFNQPLSFQQFRPFDPQDATITSPTGSTPYWPSGPPQKPRQSGHAVWVGNLPRYTQMVDLKDHFSRGLRDDVESVKLLQRTNCAFVNYSSRAACEKAVQQFDRQPFGGTRLVCRVRQSHVTNEPAEPPSVTGIARDIVGIQQEPKSAAIDITKPQDRYFILKSLTTQDLESSVRNNTWATQAHNETSLARAFEESERVWFLFSVNKSREFYGVAQMVSGLKPAVRDSEMATPPTGPQISEQFPTREAAKSGGPAYQTTPATEHAPAGFILDDSIRGTLFWEARNEVHKALGPTQPSVVVGQRSSSPLRPRHNSISSTSQGNSFDVSWKSLHRIPFKRVKGLRNPLNDNRPLQVARDCTPVDPAVGARMLALFGVIPNAQLSASAQPTLPQTSAALATSFSAGSEGTNDVLACDSRQPSVASEIETDARSAAASSWTDLSIDSRPVSKGLDSSDDAERVVPTVA